MLQRNRQVLEKIVEELLEFEILTQKVGLFIEKSEKPNRKWDTEEPELRPEYRSISCELRALARMVRDEFGKEESNNANNGDLSVEADVAGRVPVGSG
uniref:Uncharacterized protein n=1 Tax=Fagus sylvatica TaxID=28930 RepID=A0A2N9F3W9_FAGSY